MSEEQFVARVREQVNQIILKGLEQIDESKEILESLPQKTEAKIEALFASYSDVSKALQDLGHLMILGINADTVKLARFSPKENYVGDSGAVISVNNYNQFYQHPSGQYFKLDPEKKYRLLVAFLPEEPKQ